MHLCPLIPPDIALRVYSPQPSHTRPRQATLERADGRERSRGKAAVGMTALPLSNLSSILLGPGKRKKAEGLEAGAGSI